MFPAEIDMERDCIGTQPNRIVYATNKGFSMRLPPERGARREVDNQAEASDRILIQLRGNALVHNDAGGAAHSNLSNGILDLVDPGNRADRDSVIHRHDYGFSRGHIHYASHAHALPNHDNVTIPHCLPCYSIAIDG